MVSSRWGSPEPMSAPPEPWPSPRPAARTEAELAPAPLPELSPPAPEPPVRSWCSWSRWPDDGSTSIPWYIQLWKS